MTTKHTSKLYVVLKATVFASFAAIIAITFSGFTKIKFAKMDYMLIANESFQSTPKFELDLFSGNRQFNKANERIWLSVAGNSAKVLSNGKYVYSANNANTRSAFEFMGSVKNGADDIAIVDGEFTVDIKETNLHISYNLTLENGTKVTGKYNGKYQTADWRK